MTKTKKIGRPKLPKGKAKAVFSLRLSSEDQRQIDSAAKRSGKPVTQWAREKLLAASANG